MIVHISKEIPMRSSGEGTWVEPGDYEVLRELDDKRYLIILAPFHYRKYRQLTIVREDEIEP